MFGLLVRLRIYNSRNCLGRIDIPQFHGSHAIYNSRNCLGRIDDVTD